jgi:RNA-binding protein YlmH
MSEREKILRYYRSAGEGEIAAKLVDAAESVARNTKVKVSEFLDPHGFSMAEIVTAHYNGVRLETFGGYEGAERIKAAFVQSDFSGQISYNIAVVAVAWDKRFAQLSHRDVLGAALGVGLDRGVIGDIVMSSDGCFIIVDKTIIRFLLAGLTQIGPTSVSVSEGTLDQIPPKEEKLKEIRTTAASLRLDVIAAAGFGTSRTRMADDIVANKVKLNWQETRKSDQSIKAGDIISMHGRGRLEVSEILGTTKKGRLSLLLKRYT